MARLPSACSGERYCGVPITWPVSVSADPLGGAGDAEVGDLDLRRSGVTSRLAGLTSRCTMPAAWAAPRASAAWASRSRRQPGSSGAPGRSSAESGWPSTQLHHQVRARGRRPVGRGGLAEVEDRGDARVVQRGGVPRLGLEAGAEHRVVGVLRLEHLDRHRPRPARCRWRARPRPCRRWRSATRGGSAARRRRTVPAPGVSGVTG